jgi:hypothetical protein
VYTEQYLQANNKTAQLKAENSAQITFWFSPISFCVPRHKHRHHWQPTHYASKIGGLRASHMLHQKQSASL